MKELWPKTAIHDYTGELGNLAQRLNRPVLQDLANVIVIMSDFGVDELTVSRRVIKALLEGQFEYVQSSPVDAGQLRIQAYLIATYGIQLVKDVLTTMFFEDGKCPKGSFDLEGLKTFFKVDNLDDLARVIADRFGFKTDGIEHPWESCAIPSKVDTQTRKALEFWI